MLKKQNSLYLNNMNQPKSKTALEIISLSGQSNSQDTKDKKVFI